MKIRICIFFILFANTILAQESDTAIVDGKISANAPDLEGVYVINLKTEKSTITEKDGYFSIAAIPGDTLIFSAIHLKEIRIGLEQKDFEKEVLLVKMEAVITHLNEVVVRRYDNINAVAMGISPKEMIRRTHVERKLYTAKSTSGDAILNMISGRTAMLKKEMAVETKLSFISQLENMFDKNHFINVLKIPLEYVKGFEYYIVENLRFTTILKSKNKAMTEFLMGELAVKYNEIIACENE